jgi:hypothetical protein
MGSKETWALISIMVYAFVIHARFVPSTEENGFQFNGMFCFYFDFVHPITGKLSSSRITLMLVEKHIPKLDLVLIRSSQLEH